MIEFHIKTTADQIESLSNDLQLFNVIAISVNDAKGDPIYEPPPGEIIYWQEVTLIAYFEEAHQEVIKHFLQKAKQQQHIQDYSQHITPEKDWIKASYDQFKPLHIGKRLLICPTWDSAEQSNAVIVKLDPGLAFGTGTHPTTKLCLEWLEKNIKGYERMLDFGCGSGILAVSALKLGAAHATAVDHDEQALFATQQNAILNHVSGQIETCLPQQFVTKPYDIVVANILSTTIIQLLPIFKDCVTAGGQIVLSGILQEQVETIIQAYQAYFEFQIENVLDNWVVLCGTAKCCPSS